LGTRQLGPEAFALSKGNRPGRAKVNRAPIPAFTDKEWKPNGREGLPSLNLDSELDALKDF